ncbi:hypothetical protein QMO56_25580 [Roseomonas sp. E05]|nr:hypothetical protein [Roseomonas sp. E05]MDJ0391478.1 hypothetical protein [Roseomonas sp. E05]
MPKPAASRTVWKAPAIFFTGLPRQVTSGPALTALIQGRRKSAMGRIGRRFFVWTRPGGFRLMVPRSRSHWKRLS